MPWTFPAASLRNDGPQARRLRPRERARPRAGCRVRGGCGAARRLRAGLVVRRGGGGLPAALRRRASDRRVGTRGTRAGAPPRDRVPVGAQRRGGRSAAWGPSVRRAGVRHLRAPVKARLFTDDGARGNPGPAAFSFVLEADDGTVLASHGERIGVATNNVAEYRGLVAGLAKAVEFAVPEVEVVSDSELLVKQMRGEYRVRNRALQELFGQASRLADRLPRVRYTHVRRADNQLADRLRHEARLAARRGPPTRR